jgi:hypothetical protein
VITRTSRLDPLFQGLPIVIVEDWEEVKDPANLRKWLEAYAPLTEREALWSRLDPQRWLAPIREDVRRAAAAPVAPASAAKEASAPVAFGLGSAGRDPK